MYKRHDKGLEILNERSEFILELWNGMFWNILNGSSRSGIFLIIPEGLRIFCNILEYQ